MMLPHVHVGLLGLSRQGSPALLAGLPSTLRFTELRTADLANGPALPVDLLVVGPAALDLSHLAWVAEVLRPPPREVLVATDAPHSIPARLFRQALGARLVPENDLAAETGRAACRLLRPEPCPEVLLGPEGAARLSAQDVEFLATLRTLSRFLAREWAEELGISGHALRARCVGCFGRAPGDLVVEYQLWLGALARASGRTLEEAARIMALNSPSAVRRAYAGRGRPVPPRGPVPR